jgi:hypothetical protein
MNHMNRVSSCAVVVLVLVLWPAIARTEATDVTPQNSASQPTAAKATPATERADVGKSTAKSVERIQSALDGRLKDTGLDFTDTPLEQIVKSLQDEYNIPIQLDLPALSDAGLNAQQSVSIDLHDISLKSALQIMLRQHHLTYVIQNEALTITTPEQAETCLVTRVYDVRDVPSGSGDDIHSLVDAIISCVATESWAAKGGGQAQIRPLKPGVLVVSQTQAVHEQIGNLLDALRQVR